MTESMTESKIKDGVSTSEYQVVTSPSWVGTIALLLGSVVSILGPMVESLGSNSFWGIICGAIVAIFDLARKAMLQACYVRNRTALKKQEILNG